MTTLDRKEIDMTILGCLGMICVGFCLGKVDWFDADMKKKNK